MLFNNAAIYYSLIILNFIKISSFAISFYSYKNLTNSTTQIEILDYLKNNIRYNFIKIGEKSQKLPIILTSHDSFSIIKKNNCPIYSNYDVNISKTMEKYYIKSNDNFFYFKDYISFDDINKDIFFTFIHYNQTNSEDNNNCGYIGLQNNLEEREEGKTNLFIQLKKMNIINKSIYYFNYTENNEVILNAGIEPYELNDTLYSEENMKILEVDEILDNEKKIENIGKYRWNLNISKVFYFRKLPIQSKIDPYVEISRLKTRRVGFFQALLVPEDILIKGPFEYQEQIEEDYFYDLFKDNICKKINFERKYFFLCKKEYKNLIQTTFPSLYFFSEELNYIFELNFNDLFIEHGQYLIFAIYFDFFQIEIFEDAFLSEWFFGEAFLKKYSFSFDLDNGKIRFYKENAIKRKFNKKLEKKEEKKTNIKYYQLGIGIIVVVLAIGIFAFINDRISKRKPRNNNSNLIIN